MKKIFFFVLAAFLGISQLSKADDVTASVAKVKFNYCFTTYADEALTIGKDLLDHYQWEGNTCVSGKNTYLKLNGQNDRGCDHYKRMTLTVDENSEVREVAINVFSNVFDGGNTYKYPGNPDVTFAQSELNDNNQAVKYNCILRPDDQTKDILEKITLTVVEVPTGAIPGMFSVSPTKKVYFSQGTLQYSADPNQTHKTLDSDAAQGIFQFAANQYDFLDYSATSNSGNAISNNRGTQTKFIDHFRWGTSGCDATHMPWNYNTTSGLVFAPGLHDLVNDEDGQFAKYDWGKYNEISNGGEGVGLWRTLLFNEWNYVFMERPNAADKRAFTQISCNQSKNPWSICGVLLLPDDFVLPEGCTFEAKWYNDRQNAYDANYYDINKEEDLVRWQKMQAAGAVFIPFLGAESQYVGTNVNSTFKTANGYTYWTASAYEVSGYENCARYYALYYVQPTSNYYKIRNNGLPVRLVQDAK